MPANLLRENDGDSNLIPKQDDICVRATGKCSLMQSRNQNITYIKHLNDPHEDMYENPNTSSKVTGNLKARLICHPAIPLLFQTIAVLISQLPQGTKAEIGTQFWARSK